MAIWVTLASQVEKFIGDDIPTSTGNFLESDVMDIVDEIESSVKGVLYALGVSGVDSVVTAPISFKILRNIVLEGVASRVIKALYPALSVDQYHICEYHDKKYREGIKQIKEMPKMLMDGTHGTAVQAGKDNLGMVSSFNETEYPTDYSRKFTKDMDF